MTAPRRPGALGAPPAPGAPSAEPGPLDLRLLAPAAGAWAGAALGAQPGRGVVLVPAAAVVLAACTLLAADCAMPSRLVRRFPVLGRLQAVARVHRPAGGGTRLVHVVAAGAVCLLAGVTAAALRVGARDAGPLDALARRRATVTVEAVVTGDPQPLRSAVVGARRVDGGVVVPARVELLAGGVGPVRLRHPVTVFGHGPAWRGLLPGARVRLTAAAAPGGDRAVALLRARGDPVPLRGPPLWSRVAGRLRAGLHEAARPLPPAARGLLPGLVVGDVSRLDPAVREDFRRTGMTHLVAVSGTNCSILLAVTLLVCRLLGVRRWLAVGLAVAVLVGFVLLARPSPSVLRAAVMGLLGLLALATDRERDGVPVLCGAVVGLVLFVPELARSPGFALSTSATAGLLVLGPRLRRRLAVRLPGRLADVVAVPLAAQLGCAPVLAGLYGHVGLVAVPANVVAAPAVGAATVCGVVAALLAPVAMPLARLAARLAGLPTGWLVGVARWFARLPFGGVPWPRGWLGAALLVATLTALARAAAHRQLRRPLGTLACAALVAAAGVRVVAPGWPPPGWVLVACDVGQGDALVLRGDRDAVVVDAGPDPLRVDRCLADLRVRRVAAVVLTHLHADHVEGLPGVLRGRRVGRVLLGPLDEPADELARVRAWTSAARIGVARARLGDAASVGSLRYDVVGPAAAFRGTASDPNNSSLVLRVRAGGLVLLLTGDAEEPAQRAALRLGAALAADVLKVPHHGSDRQVGEFLTTVGARVAVTSVGADNPYGHPADRTLDRLAATGARGFRTDLDGDVAVLARGRRTDPLRVVARRRPGLAGRESAAGGPRPGRVEPRRREPPGTSPWSVAQRPVQGPSDVRAARAPEVAAGAPAGIDFTAAGPRAAVWCPVGSRAPPPPPSRARTAACAATARGPAGGVRSCGACPPPARCHR